MSITDHKIGPDIYDNPLRFLVPSHSNPAKKYLVDLAGYSCNGQCVCKDFTTRKEPLLRRGVTPEEAVKEGWADPKPGTKMKNVLRCIHIIEAREAFADIMIQALDRDEKARAAKAGHR